MHHLGHTLQLFDDDASRARVVARLVQQCLTDDSALLVLIGAGHWQQAARQCAAMGIQVDDAVRRGQLTVLDAGDLLHRLIRSEVPDGDAFEETIGRLMRRLSAGPRPLRAYGELVDLLASKGDFRGALELESFWNALLADVPVDLLCGYSSIAFGNPESGGALDAICAAHGRVRADRDDALASFLIGGTHPRCDGRLALTPMAVRRSG